MGNRIWTSVLGAVVAALVALSLVACGSGGSGQGTVSLNAPANAGNADTTWTVMLYMCGSDLESQGGLAMDNLEELASVPKSDKVTYVVETGGAKQWSHNDIPADRLSRYSVSDNSLTLEDERPLDCMGDASVLADFVMWGKREHPADKYMLVFWDHGGGSLTGVCNDEIFTDRYGNSDTLTLPEIDEALTAADVNFEVVGFDTCLMASLENAEMLSKHAKYMVASEETEPGSGWDYASWPEWLAKYPGVDPADLGQAICDSYYQKCANWWVEDMTTLSVVDLSKIDKVSKAFAKASDEIILATGDPVRFRQFARGAMRAENYGGNTAYEGYTDMVDLADLMENTSDILSDKSNDVIKALESAVVYEVHGADRPEAQGLSVFYPLYVDQDVYDMYASISSNTSYLQYLAVMNGTYDQIDWDAYTSGDVEDVNPPTQEDAAVQFEQFLNDDGYFELHITKGLEYVTSVQFELGIWDEENQRYFYLGTDNDINGDYGTGVFTDNFKGTWLGIDGLFVCATLSEETDSQNMYTSPIKLNGKRSNIKASYSYKTGTYKILGTFDGIDEASGLAGKSLKPLKEGDEITFLFPTSQFDSTEAELVETNTIVWKKGIKMEDVDLGDGSFVYSYEITDAFGNKQYTDSVYMNVEGEIITPEFASVG